MMGRPDFFFIVGAPKCGTTAMTDYLRQHPDVGLVLKEPHFFGSDLAVSRRVETEPEYLDLYRGNDHAKLVGDASVFYLHSLCAAQEIKAFAPGARIVAMLRNPVDMLHSLHSQLVFIDSEDIIDFEAALDADSDRLRGHRLPQHRVLSQSGYRNIARYTAQLRRYFDSFGREGVHTVIYDDFAAEPGRSYARVCEFLGIDSGFRPIVRVVNPNKRARSKVIRRVVEHPSPAIRRVVHALPTQTLRRRVSATVKRANTRFEPREPMPAQLRQRLNAEFASEVQQLSELLGRDLTSWSHSR
jgi:Sulfotransferase domain